MTNKDRVKQEAKNYLLELINGIVAKGDKPKLTIFLKSVSRSGINRKMIVFFNNEVCISHYVNDLLGYTNKQSTGYQTIDVRSCGMDITFWLANTISDCLWPNKNSRPNYLTGNGGGCLEYTAIY